uniref:Uncharacterized protein n=1 Tax=Setaria viridis TaxID=4556 RepID=A0A4U6VZB2_SETVI|nr:hypothetical protein SEVIR_2G234200v2 [Setaria viridis]
MAGWERQRRGTAAVGKWGEMERRLRGFDSSPYLGLRRLHGGKQEAAGAAQETPERGGVGRKAQCVAGPDEENRDAMACSSGGARGWRRRDAVVARRQAAVQHEARSRTGAWGRVRPRRMQRCGEHVRGSGGGAWCAGGKAKAACGTASHVEAKVRAASTVNAVCVQGEGVAVMHWGGDHGERVGQGERCAPGVRRARPRRRDMRWSQARRSSVHGRGWDRSKALPSSGARRWRWRALGEVLAGPGHGAGGAGAARREHWRLGGRPECGTGVAVGRAGFPIGCLLPIRSRPIRRLG